MALPTTGRRHPQGVHLAAKEAVGARGLTCSVKSDAIRITYSSVLLEGRPHLPMAHDSAQPRLPTLDSISTETISTFMSNPMPEPDLQLVK